MSPLRAYEASEVTEFDEFMSLESEWNALVKGSESDSPFLHHEWFRMWWSHFGGNARLAVVTVRKEGRLVLVIPLMETVDRPFGIPVVVLRSLTNLHSFRYQIVAERGELLSLAAAWELLRLRPRRWDFLELQHVSGTSLAHEDLLEVAFEDGHRMGIWRGFDSPRLRIQGGWEGYLASLKPKFRSNLRNRMKRIQQIGPLGYELVRGPEDLAASLSEAFAIEQLGWKGEQGSAVASDSTLVRFYTEIGEHASRNDWLRLWFLRLGDRRVAFEYDLEYKGVLYCMKIGYDPALHPYSPGQLLKAAVLERAFADGLAEYDFLGKMTDAKRDWTSEGRPSLWIYLYGRSALAKILHTYKFTFKQTLRPLFSS